MSEQTVKLSFGTLANGAVEERFQQELEKVLKNIMDPNTDFKAARNLTVKLSFKTNEERQIASVDFSIVPKVAPVKNIQTAIIIGEDMTGQVVTKEILKQVPGQTMISGTESPTSVTPVAQFKPAAIK